MNRPRLEVFDDAAAAADAAAGLIAAGLAPYGVKSLIVTGGSSPGPVYDRLCALDLRWDQVTVTLSDDRWVDPQSPLSNARLVRDRLLVGPASRARFLPLKGHGATPEEDAAAVEPQIASLAPFAAALLGMGDDGHIGSLFPGAPGLADALDPDGARLCVGVPVAGLEPFVPRISLTLRALLLSERLILLIAGEAKRALVERVLADPAYDPPVAAILRQDRKPVSLLWAP